MAILFKSDNGNFQAEIATDVKVVTITDKWHGILQIDLDKVFDLQTVLKKVNTFMSIIA